MNPTPAMVQAERIMRSIEMGEGFLKMSRFPDYAIVNIRRGVGERSRWIYAELRDSVSGELLIAATLDYIVEQLEQLTLIKEC